jgi:light-regulated signal transduction histidine kinase (bacteriophytochrome)
MRMSLPMREILRGLGNIASTNIEKLLYESRIRARRPLARAPPKGSPFAYITSSSNDLRHMFGADFGFLVIKGEARTIGKLTAYSECIALLQYIRRSSFTSLFSTPNIEKDCPDLDYPPGLSLLAGMLVIPLSLTGSEFLVFLRKGREKEINWAGNPYEKDDNAGRSYLEPRSSFKRWNESVKGSSRAWTEDESKFPYIH